MVSSRDVPVLVHATDTVSRAVGELQLTVGQGPSVDARETGGAVLVPDLDDTGASRRERWPAFLAEVGRTGARAMFAFPIQVGDVALGTLDLYRRTPGALGPAEIAIGLTAGAAVGDTMIASADGDGEARYPLTVHRAAGMVMVQLESTIEDALVRLRATAYAEGARLTTVAAEVLDGRRRFSREEGSR